MYNVFHAAIEIVTVSTGSELTQTTDIGRYNILVCDCYDFLILINNQII